jgi:phosphinothricin acetyltransferase
MIREATDSDTKMIADIYNYYILNTIVTFELDPVTPEEIARRMEIYRKIGPYLVYEEAEKILGYAYISRFRERKAYENSVESTIYLKNGLGGRGVGFKLYAELLSRVSQNYHAIIGGIALPNDASVKLHEKCGKWIDVGFWQREGNV